MVDPAVTWPPVGDVTGQRVVNCECCYRPFKDLSLTFSCCRPSRSTSCGTPETGDLEERTSTSSRANLTYRPHSALSTSLTPRYPPPSLRAIHLTPRYPPHRLHLRDSHEKQPARCSLQPSAPRRDRLRCGYSMCKEAGRPLGILHQNP